MPREVRELSEQERLARLVGAENREPIDSASLIEDFLKNKLGGVSEEKIEETKREIQASGNSVDSGIKRISKVGKSEGTSLPSDFSVESLLLELYDLRESLINVFELAGINNTIAEKVGDSIDKAERFINKLGGDIEKFVPLNHISGLQAPDQVKNAERVIQTTLQCYKLGKVETATIKEDGKIIHIVFSGNSGNTYYKAFGDISAEEWAGNEAIDYVYTPGAGNMTVKAYENGRWLVKNASYNSKYKALWTLEEYDGKQIPIEKKGNSQDNNELKQALKSVMKEEVKNQIENKEEEEIGEPLEEK